MGRVERPTVKEVWMKLKMYGKKMEGYVERQGVKEKEGGLTVPF